MVPSAPPGGGQPDESDYLSGSGKDKPAVGYDGDYSALGLTSREEDQIDTYQHDADGNPVLDGSGNPVTVDAQDAFTNTKVDLRSLASSFVGGPATDPLQPEPGKIDSTTLGDGSNGDINDFKVTYIGGDAGTVSGQIEGSGVLVIDGNVHISGQLTWYGLVIVLGDLQMTGGGSEIHIFGSIMVESESVVGCNADIWWSQEAIDKVYQDLASSFTLQVIPKVWRALDKSEVENGFGM